MLFVKYFISGPSIARGRKAKRPVVYKRLVGPATASRLGFFDKSLFSGSLFQRQATSSAVAVSNTMETDTLGVPYHRTRLYIEH
jgi:hypothetical protein